MSLDATETYIAKVAEGRIGGATLKNLLGERESMSTTASGEDIWRGNDLTPAPTSTTSIPTPSASGEAMSFVCESANDTAAGSGIQEVEFDTLDGDGNEVTVVKETDGTTPVSLGTSCSFINGMHSSRVGSGGVSAGHIKVYQTADSGLVYNMIAAGGNMSLVPVFKVPTGKVMIIYGWHGTEAQNKRCAIRLRSTAIHGANAAGIFTFQDTVYLKQSASGHLPCYFRCPAGTIIKVSGWAVVSGAEVGVAFSGVLKLI